MKYLILLCTMLFTINSYGYTQCNTELPCQADEICTCTISPDSGYDRYFYVDFTAIKKGHQYQCQLSDSLQHLVALPDASQFPAGSTYKIANDVQHFPFIFSLDTAALQNDTDHMRIKYLAPANDMPTTLTANCTTIS